MQELLVYRVSHTSNPSGQGELTEFILSFNDLGGKRNPRV